LGLEEPLGGGSMEDYDGVVVYTMTDEEEHFDSGESDVEIISPFIFEASIGNDDRAHTPTQSILDLMASSSSPIIPPPLVYIPKEDKFFNRQISRPKRYGRTNNAYGQSGHDQLLPNGYYLGGRRNEDRQEMEPSRRAASGSSLTQGYDLTGWDEASNGGSDIEFIGVDESVDDTRTTILLSSSEDEATSYICQFDEDVKKSKNIKSKEQLSTSESKCATQGVITPRSNPSASRVTSGPPGYKEYVGQFESTKDAEFYTNSLDRVLEVGDNPRFSSDCSNGFEIGSLNNNGTTNTVDWDRDDVRRTEIARRRKLQLIRNSTMFREKSQRYNESLGCQSQKPGAAKNADVEQSVDVIYDSDDDDCEIIDEHQSYDFHRVGNDGILVGVHNDNTSRSERKGSDRRNRLSILQNGKGSAATPKGINSDEVLECSSVIGGARNACAAIASQTTDGNTFKKHHKGHKKSSLSNNTLQYGTIEERNNDMVRNVDLPSSCTMADIKVTEANDTLLTVADIGPPAILDVNLEKEPAICEPGFNIVIEGPPHIDAFVPCVTNDRKECDVVRVLKSTMAEKIGESVRDLIDFDTTSSVNKSLFPSVNTIAECTVQGFMQNNLNCNTEETLSKFNVVPLKESETKQVLAVESSSFVHVQTEVTDVETKVAEIETKVADDETNVVVMESTGVDIDNKLADMDSNREPLDSAKIPETSNACINSDKKYILTIRNPSHQNQSDNESSNIIHQDTVINPNVTFAIQA